MRLSPRDVTAIIVTRGNVDLVPILNTLPYPKVEVWDNSLKNVDAGCAGRYLASLLSETDVVYFQDDDLIFTAHEQLMSSWKPGEMTVNMPSPWYERTGYDTLGCCQVGAGASSEWWLPQTALALYEQAGFPQDQVFREYADMLVGMLTPFTRHDFGYRILDYASGPGRTHGAPGYQERRAEMIQRAETLRQPLAA